MPTTGPLSGRVALITGASRRRGIGFATAGRLAELGAAVFLHGHPSYDREQPWGGDAGGAAALADELRARGARAAHGEADFLDPEAPAQMLEAAVAALGPVDNLIVNHAYSTQSPFLETTAEEIDRHLLVNVRASLLLVQAFARQHEGRSGGRVVLLTSGQHLGPMGGEVAYAASKGALQQITATLSDLLIQGGITVNTVNPGPTDTGWADDAVREQIGRRFPLRRWGTPDDAARLIAWLCTDEAAWVTGQVIDSEGGFRRG